MLYACYDILYKYGNESLYNIKNLNFKHGIGSHTVLFHGSVATYYIHIIYIEAMD